MDDIAVILLAAGRSSRMGRPKQLLDLRGEPMIRRVASIAVASVCRPVIVVLGHAAADCAKTLQGLPVQMVLNPSWADGMGTSIRAGTAAAAKLDSSAVVVALADQPNVTTDHLDALVRTHRRSAGQVVATTYGGTVGVPALFPRSWFPALLGLSADEGCRALLRRGADRWVGLPCPEALDDVDTPDDYAVLLARVDSLRNPMGGITASE